MSILDTALKKSKDFLKSIKKETKKVSRNFIKDWRRKYADRKSVDKFKEGSLLAFTYNALDKNNKFDKKPLIVCLGFAKPRGKIKANKYIYGLNLHWLPKNQRVLLASLIVEMLKRKKGKLDYEDVKPLIKKFEGSPILRMYVVRRISQKIIKMPEDVYLRAASIDFAQWSA
jgi:hypothetical protein